MSDCYYCGLPIDKEYINMLKGGKIYKVHNSCVISARLISKNNWGENNE